MPPRHPFLFFGARPTKGSHGFHFDRSSLWPGCLPFPSVCLSVCLVCLTCCRLQETEHKGRFQDGVEDFVRKACAVWNVGRLLGIDGRLRKELTRRRLMCSRRVVFGAQLFQIVAFWIIESYILNSSQTIEEP